MEKKNIFLKMVYGHKNGASGGIRTHTVFLPQTPQACVSAYSTTLANLKVWTSIPFLVFYLTIFYYIYFFGICKDYFIFLILLFSTIPGNLPRLAIGLPFTSLM